LFADRRAGSDRRQRARRTRYVGVAVDRRQSPDRRTGADRRSTLERRRARRRIRPPGTESPGQHLRNALQLLYDLARPGLLSDDDGHTLHAATQRVEMALRQVEPR
jgi:hypothetical protein